jgi:HJR/Mrr/RecB family endonuclease
LSFFKPRRKRKTKEQKARAKGRRSYKKGLDGEAKADPLLRQKGYRVHKTRTHSRSRAEFDRLATDKHGRTYGVEVKYTKQKVTTPVVRKLKKKVGKSGLLHGGIIVSRKGLTSAAEKEAKRLDVKSYTLKRKRKKKTGFFLF